ncbi:MAG: hypothetical protein M3O24_00785 [Thermoproteota archaeon]|nr:hypothetical protein [Thermoproteota archaeon]
MIRRLQQGYTGIGALHSKEDKEKIRFCQRCEDLFRVQAVLGPRIMPLDDPGKPIPKPHDYDLWLECRNCGTVYAKHETKVEPTIEPVVDAKTSPFSKSTIRGITNKKKRQRGTNPRINTRDEITDDDVKRELKAGRILVSYSSTDPINL